VTATIYEVLGDLRANALDERDKSDEFERLIKTYLLNDSEWSARFSNVWMWSEWPGREDDRTRGSTSWRGTATRTRTRRSSASSMHRAARSR